MCDWRRNEGAHPPREPHHMGQHRWLDSPKTQWIPKIQRINQSSITIRLNPDQSQRISKNPDQSQRGQETWLQSWILKDPSIMVWKNPESGLKQGGGGMGFNPRKEFSLDSTNIGKIFTDFQPISDQYLSNILTPIQYLTNVWPTPSQLPNGTRISNQFLTNIQTIIQYPASVWLIPNQHLNGYPVYNQLINIHPISKRRIQFWTNV